MKRESTVTVSLRDVPIESQQAARLKFAILVNGLRLTESATSFLFDGGSKKPIRTRSGVSGGLDLQLSESIFVNAPVNELNAATSPLFLDRTEGELFVSEDSARICTVNALPEPHFYARRTSDDSESMVRIGQMCSPDRLCYGMTGPGCSFWAVSERCRYCSIGLNAPSDASRKSEYHLYEVIEAAIEEKQWSARHILLGGGTPQGSDMGAILAARLCVGIKKRFNISVYAMIAAPLEDQYIDLLYDSGVDELGINIEFWSDDAWNLYIPGKNDRIGKARYLQALEYAFNLFGTVRTRSIIIAGLERAEDTLDGITALANLGVMPIISPFRPLAGAVLEKIKRFGTEDYIDLYQKAKNICDGTGVPLGPTCICCQNNTLTLPFGIQYKRY